MITQSRFSESVKFFKSEFNKLWNLKELTDKASPCVFFGVYSTADVELINNYKGFKVIFFLGADLPNLSRIGKRNTLFCSDKHNILDIYKSQKLNYYNGIIPVKDYNIFKQYPKGEKIYVYRNNTSEGTHKKFKLCLLEPAIKYFGKDKFLFGIHGNSIETMINDYYKQSFVNIQLNEMAGFASAIEMAYTPTNIIELIKNEMTSPLDNSVKNYINYSNKWLNES